MAIAIRETCILSFPSLMSENKSNIKLMLLYEVHLSLVFLCLAYLPVTSRSMFYDFMLKKSESEKQHFITFDKRQWTTVFINCSMEKMAALNVKNAFTLPSHLHETSAF